MKWEGRRRSRNVEDRRGRRSGPSGGRSGRRVRIPMPRGRAARGGGGGLLMLLVVLGVAWLLGINPLSLIGGDLSNSGGSYTQRPSDNLPMADAGEDRLLDFVAVNLAETEDLWTLVFEQNDMTYVPPKLVLFSGQTTSPCGVASARTGPFYCPGDQKIYLDPAFYAQLRDQFGASGDFAQAYVLAHEVGHHVQQLVGTLPEFNRLRGALPQEEENAYSVRIELQADCYAGIWANYVGEQNLLDRGDIREALNAAEQIGDDTLQKRTQGFAVPKTFSHGTSAQRMEWFSRGYKTGDVQACDTIG
ncbi:KPN_02809 family neutral zinc metallopeptidase [Maritalea myrionectae]|uniref:KPN_02809 family neutral zinc metallopeptidase n=1 Tax=Maritalea myrionectae TaxID=454601 RepID=UPI000481E286|nr:neutral zinc metallopeptidase [Maritalea myrionectae]